MMLERAMIPDSVRIGAENQVELRLTPEGSPLASPSCVIRVAASTSPDQDDIIEYRWKYDPIEMELRQSLNAIELRVDLKELEAAAKAAWDSSTGLAVVRSLVGALLKLRGRDGYGREFALEIPWPSRLVDGMEFSTNPERRIDELQAWHERVDFAVRGGSLRVLLYNRIPQFPGFRDGSKWFPDDFRAMVHQKAREQGKPTPAPRNREKE
ncbi:MAG: hypothetical protein HY763_09725 [Planctomycetes bacterium]|nr:hypothetical protein [Planctomycetota bacterium]